MKAYRALRNYATAVVCAWLCTRVICAMIVQTGPALSAHLDDLGKHPGKYMRTAK